ncbi:histone deacetylase family protein [Umboniibacter marinipuniceus]|uniref:Acetoin utilization deacetylase AcuC-like enzyme n=1 Tax=Umboniibacter marinipuniceus TaxID=569599 RepID=A0A3M0APS3_9GAMM|nr:histone deacetylase [Umboniibacter marinipuniceus]RMA81022.1 acetoin utilization deacetylase AcuC-like enzyme [Umboniibacter marinipuniceus]
MIASLRPSLPAVWHPDYSFDFSPSHRFPMSKFELLYRYLKESGALEQLQLHQPDRVTMTDLLRAHDGHYVDAFIHNRLDKQAMRRLGIPWSEGLLNRTLLSPAGTIKTIELALEHGLACHLAGGTHHAHRDFASGFCIFNDMAIAALKAVEEWGLQSVLIFDLDVHQGDGTAAILADHPHIHTVSVHCEKNFPVRKQSSSIDIGLPVGLGDDEYLRMVDSTLQMAMNSFQPDLVIYDAGVDVFEGDPLGRLNISAAGLRQRERQVLSALYGEVPVATVIGGGYDDDREALSHRHAMVIEAALVLTRGEAG